MMHHAPTTKPDRVFWWGFYEKPSADEFFEAALEFMSGGRIVPRGLPSAAMKAQVIAAMLGSGRFLIILDGLEMMQHQAGDRYGLLRGNNLRDFLALIAAPGHDSFCLVTSRAPLLDLMEYTTYNHRDVDRLRPAEGRDLLRNVGVQGSDAALEKLVADWDGHALTLGLVGAYAVWRCGGDATRLGDTGEFVSASGASLLQDGVPDAARKRYDHVRDVLRRYDTRLTEEERAFLILFSAFRTPVEANAFDDVFRTKREATDINARLAVLGDEAFGALVDRLLAYRLLRYNPEAAIYTVHPLVRNHYTALLAGSRGAVATHKSIKDYYLSLAGRTPRHPSLEDLAPLIDVVSHACHAGAYDEASQIFWERISQGNRHVLIWELGAFETALALMRQFFSGCDTVNEPQVSKPADRGWILAWVGLSLTSLGRLGEASPFYERQIANRSELEDWHNASQGYQTLAELRTHLGELADSAKAAGEALALALLAENKWDERNSLCRQAWVAHLRGENTEATAAFRQAEVLEREIYLGQHYLYGLPGIWQAKHLRRSGKVDYARRISQTNLKICELLNAAPDISRCHRVLGELDADTGNHLSARSHYDTALKFARAITKRDVLIEALLARGRWAARRGKVAAARGDLNEALDFAVEGGYRIYEADIRVALAWGQLAAGDGKAARVSAGRALRMSEDMGYHWGQVDAQELLDQWRRFPTAGVLSSMIAGLGQNQ